MKINDILYNVNEYNDFIDDKINHFIPWVEKYRPNYFEDIIDHKYIIQALTYFLKNKQIPHLLFYGPSGTGKTSTILGCARYLYGDNYKNMILELNGSDDRGINIVREQIKEFSSSKQFINSKDNNLKLVILDEADSMTYDAQFALRKVMETYTNTTRFCLICNYQTKIISSLISRCIVLKFKPINQKIHKEKLLNIIKLENNELITCNDDVLDTIINLSEGDMRKSLNLLQTILTCNINKKIINLDNLYKLIGYPSTKDQKLISQYVFDKSIKLNDSIVKLNKIKIDLNISTIDIIKELLNYIITNLNTELFNDIIIEKLILILAEFELKTQGNTSDNIQMYGLLCSIKLLLT